MPCGHTHTRPLVHDRHEKPLPGYAWFAMHLHSDPDSAMLDDAACRRTVRHLLLAAFLPAASETAFQQNG